MKGPWVFLLLLPTLAFLVVFTYLPLAVAAKEGIPALPQLLSPENLNALRVTALYTLLTAPLSVALGLLAAVAVEGHCRLRLLARALIFHPVILPTVAFAAVFLYLLNPLGPLQGTLRWLGLQNPLGDPLGAFLAVVLVGVLKDMRVFTCCTTWLGFNPFPRNSSKLRG